MEKQTGTQAETNLVDEDCNGGLNRELSGGRGGAEGDSERMPHKVIQATGRMHTLSQAGSRQREPQEAWRPESAMPTESCEYLHAPALWLFERCRRREVWLEGL